MKNGEKRCRNSISKHRYFLHQRASPIDRHFFFFFSLLAYVPGSYSSYVEKYHFIRAPCAAIKHVYEAYRNFMKSGIESVWTHNDENNKRRGFAKSLDLFLFFERIFRASKYTYINNNLSIF